MIKKLVNFQANLGEFLSKGSRPVWLAFFVLACHHFWVHGFFLDGAIYAALGKSLAQTSNWLVPSFNQFELNPFFEHPPFYFMFEALIFKIIGISWGSARIVSLLFAMGIILVLRKLLKKFGTEHSSFWGPLFLIFTPLFLKLARYPNLDMAMSFFGLFGLYYFLSWIEAKNSKHWIYSGLFLGGAFLIKGHAAIMFPASLFLYCLLSKKFKTLYSIKFLSIFIIALFLFSLWPLALYSKGQIVVFTSWFQKQFFTTVVKARGLQESNYFLYVIILLKSAAPWLILTVISTFLFFKRKGPIQTSSSLLMLSLFWATLIPFSLVRWKYSHYLAPLLPAMATLSADWMKFLSLRKLRIIWNSLSFLLILAGIILWTTPIGGKNHREPVLFELIALAKKLSYFPPIWVDVGNAYGYWSFSSTLQFETDAIAVRQSAVDLMNFLAYGTRKYEGLKGPRLYYMSANAYKEISTRFRDTIIDKFIVLKTYPSGNVAMVEKEGAF